MYLLINAVGVIIFIAVAVLLSKDRQKINRRAVGSLLALNFIVAWFLTAFSVGRDIIQFAAAAFTSIINVSYVGIAFAFNDWVNVPQMNFFVGALLPILLIVPVFDILSYVGIMSRFITIVSRALTFIIRTPKFETFFSIEMMFLGNTDSLAVSTFQLKAMPANRQLTLAMMSMSCIAASIVGAYIQMMPPEFVLTAIPLNIINALLVVNILNPVDVPPSEDTIVDISTNENREPFFAFLSASIMKAGRLIFIICASVITFVALAALINKLLALINPSITLESILGMIMFPCAWLMGLESAEAFQLAQYMGTKLITNEFVVMLEAQHQLPSMSTHMQAVTTVFVTSFANFSTIGMLIGFFNGLDNKDAAQFISKNVQFMIASGILVSLLSAGIVGLFIW